MVYKENWACAQCGMTSSRKESVMRHIVNPRIHNGRAQAVPYTDYLAGWDLFAFYDPSLQKKKTP